MDSLPTLHHLQTMQGLCTAAKHLLTLNIKTKNRIWVFIFRYTLGFLPKNVYNCYITF